MNKRYVLILISMVFIGSVKAQFEPVLICSTNVSDATGPNNSHKIAMRHESNDTIHIVFHCNDSVKYVRSCNRGLTWETPRNVAKGIYPAIDIDQRGYRHVVYQVYDTVNYTYEIYCYCLDIRSPPRNISETPGNSVNPSLVVDQNNVVHIVWADATHGPYRIYYRNYDFVNLSDTFYVSQYGSNEAIHTRPAIGIYEPNDRIYVAWQCYDPLCYTHYWIHYRYRETTAWSDVDALESNWLALGSPSLDFCHGEDELSACWQDSSSGNMEAHFHGGNGGGYNTTGYSTAPVLSTIGTTWSYLFWQDNDYDIFYHFYYFMSGWSSSTFRQRFQIEEVMFYPNCTGCYCIWTQGDDYPYKVYFCDFGLPVGIKQKTGNDLDLRIEPNPSNGLVKFSYILTFGTEVRISVYDIRGKKVKTITSNQQNPIENSLFWNGTDDLGRKVPSGIYLCNLKIGGKQTTKKIVINRN